MVREVKLPPVKRLPYDPPSPDNSPPGTPDMASMRRVSTTEVAGSGSIASATVGQGILHTEEDAGLEDGGMSRCNHRAIAEENERVLETRRRALHGTAYESGDVEVLVASMAVRVDDPMSDPQIEHAFGWLKRLETTDRGMRLLAFNPRAMQSLALLYRDTGGEKWVPHQWPTKDPRSGENALPGVEVNAMGSVVAVRLPDNRLVGVLHRDLTRGWAAIHELDLSGNRGLQGPIPGAMVQVLTHCTRLDLSGCSLEGPLPPQLSLMRAIKVLALSDNEFSGPLLARLVDCARLEVLDLSHNKFDGELPRAWGRLKALKVLRLAKNRSLTGFMPDDWAELTNLEELDVSHNHLSGPVPATVLSLLQPSGEQRRQSQRSSPSAKSSPSSPGASSSSSGAAAKLKIVKLRGNDWDPTIPRWPEGILLNRCTDLALVDLPGTASMTSRDGARKLLHSVFVGGDVPSDAGNAIVGGAGALLQGRPATAQSPRIRASTANRYVAIIGGGQVSGGFASLVLEPAPVPCTTCVGRYPTCMCVTSCAACGHFNALVEMRPARPGFGASSGCGGRCRGCGLTEAEAYKFKAAASSRVASTRARAGNSDGRRNGASASSAGDVTRDGNGVEAGNTSMGGLGSRSGRGQISRSSTGANSSSKQPVNLSSRERGLRILYPPQPLDLLRPPASQALDSFDPYADHFPF